MSIPIVYTAVKKQDFTVKPVKLFKEYNIDNIAMSTTASGYTSIIGIYQKYPTPIGTNLANNDPTNAVDGTYQSIIWKQIEHMYYRDAYVPGLTLEHYSDRETFKFLNISASYISIPYLDYGERIKAKSVKLTNNNLGITVIDDGRGNLYDPVVHETLPKIREEYIIGYWGFNDLYKFTRHGESTLIKTGDYKYTSKTFNVVDNNASQLKNVTVDNGQLYSGSNCGMSAYFNTGSYIITPHHDKLDFDVTEEFTISMWVKCTNQVTTGSIISKRGTINKSLYGKFESPGNLVVKKYNKYENIDITTNVYPYDICVENGNLNFSRSDGHNIITISGSITTNWTHVACTRFFENNIPKLALFIDGQLIDSVIDTTGHAGNDYSILFGAINRNGDDQYIGNIDEIRFVNRSFYSTGSLNTDFFERLSHVNNMFNTSIIGNVFYRSGNINISPLNPKYRNILSGSFNLNYKGTHTVYQYETIVRVRKGDYNTTLNPTILKSPKSDLYIDDIVTGTLKPYVTTIGLYNQNGDLLVVGKLGQAIQIREDVDLNFLISWDA